MFPALFLLGMQVADYADLPERPQTVVIDACRASHERLQGRVNSYHAWVRRHEWDRGGKLTSVDSNEYMNEATLAVKPYLEIMDHAPYLGQTIDVCWRAENDGWHALGDVAGARWGVSNGYVRNPNGDWVRVNKD